MNAHVGKPFSLKLLVELLLKLTRGTVTNTTVEQADKASAATATIAATAKANTARPLPPVDAVDLAGALDRLGGNQALYVRVLQSYLLDIATLPDQFDVCMSGNDLATAARLLHTAKGLSATVGASYLTAVTQQTELAIKAAIAPVDANEARAWSSSLRNAVANTRTVMREIAENCCQSGSGSTPVPPAVVMPASALTKLDSLHKLSNLLKASDMHALTVHEQIKLSHNEPESVDFKRLNLAMEAFDFSRAAQICDKLIQQSTHG
jgi:HPt (histidine-containing phosphotransfer) domain-containing protein